MADLLIVDDDSDIVETLELIMVAEGHSVRTAGDGEGGLRALAERLPDALLMDVDMPVVSGPEMAYRMLVEDCGRETVPIVMLSGSPSLEAVARTVGTPYVLAKPFGPSDVVSLVERALAERIPPTPGI